MSHHAAVRADHERLSQWRRERRRAARTHHPDVGGDLDEYLRVVGEIDARLGPSDLPSARSSARAGATTTVSGRRTAVRRRVRTATRGARRLGRGVRSRLPRGVPGARRWTEL